MEELTLDTPLVLYGAKCADCGHELTASEFSDGTSDEWPIVATPQFARWVLDHPRNAITGTWCSQLVLQVASQ